MEFYDFYGRLAQLKFKLCKWQEEIKAFGKNTDLKQHHVKLLEAQIKLFEGRLNDIRQILKELPESLQH